MAALPQVLLNTRAAVEQVRFSRFETQVAIQRTRQSLAEIRALIAELQFAYRSEGRKRGVTKNGGELKAKPTVANHLRLTNPRNANKSSTEGSATNALRPLHRFALDAP